MLDLPTPNLIVSGLAGIYIHIPFCRKACYYCDFHFSTNHNQLREVIQAIRAEIEMNLDFFDANTPISTIYFGGGTPSLLKPEEINSILHSINQVFEVDGSAEVTLEANPEDISVKTLNHWQNLGVNRLSIGVQSFDDQILSWMNRAHTGQQAKDAVLNSLASGFDNVSIDLIYGVSTRKMTDWEKEATQAVSLSPQHISAYCLTIEEKTVFGKWSKSGKLAAVNQDSAADEYEMLLDLIGTSGYQQYEVSNFARPGFQSKHNRSYWEGKPFLGIGPAAHSFRRTERRINVSNNAKYVNFINQGELPYRVEHLDSSSQMNEYIMTSLRTTNGLSTQYLMQEYSFDLIEKNKAYLQNIVAHDLGVLDENGFRLTSKGLLFADEIILELII